MKKEQRSRKLTELKNFDWKEKLPIVLVALAGLFYVALGGEMYMHAKLIALGFLQNTAFMIISRARNRSNHNYHLVASVFSNGVWFLTFSHIVQHGAPFSMFLPFLCGTALGSLFGAFISKNLIETWLKVNADASAKDGNKTYNPLLFVSLGIVGIIFFFITENPQNIAFIMILAYLQNIGFALSSRARNRGSHNYLILANLATGLFWFLTFRYLIVHNMPLFLFVPYTVATVFGSVTGARVSMMIERIFNIKPDEHVISVQHEQSKFCFIKKWWLLILIAIAGTVYILVQQSSVALGTLFLGILIFAPQSATHVIASRAGNRNKTSYHLYTRLINGAVSFLSYEYMVQYQMSGEFFVPIVLGTILGNLFGQQTGMKIESKTDALMDANRASKKL